MRMKSLQLFTLTTLIILALAACGSDGGVTQAPQDVQVETCGDGVCAEGESTESCPADCPAEDMPDVPPTEAIEPQAYVIFVVKASDFVHLADSAETLLALIELFERHGVHGEFYLTGPMARLYAEEHQDLMQRFAATKMTISYHVQPPHPLVPGYQFPLQGLPVNVTEQTILDYESMALDLGSGSLIEELPGGYRYLTEIFGSPPVAVSIPDTSMRGFALPIFQELGSGVVVLKEDAATDPDQPFRQEYSMLVRPTDILLSHWSSPGIDAAMAWWDMLGTEFAQAYRPATQLQSRIESWEAERLPFVVITLDEFNFYREGPAPWTMMYFEDSSGTQPSSPPFDLNAPDLSAARSPENASDVWQAYAELVEWAATYTQVITSADLQSILGAGD